MTAVDVWVVQTGAAALGWDASVLTDAERTAAQRLARADDRARAVTGRAALRTVLGRLLGCPPGAVALDTAGKPRLAGPNPRDVRFNLAHSGRFVLIATTAGREVGVDIEAVAAAALPTELDGVLLAPGEPASDRYATWVRKEAVLKAHGTGLARPMRELVAVGPDGRFLDRVDGCVVTGLAIDPGYAAALAVEGDPPVGIDVRRL